ncbi:Cytochrome c oxidase polypeptide VIc, partial [Harpegnathos saltator]
MSTAAKPQLHGLLTSQIKKNLIGMTIASISTAIAYKILVCDRRKQRYADFYK